MSGSYGLSEQVQLSKRLQDLVPTENGEGRLIFLKPSAASSCVPRSMAVSCAKASTSRSVFRGGDVDARCREAAPREAAGARNSCCAVDHILLHARARPSHTDGDRSLTDGARR